MPSAIVSLKSGVAAMLKKIARIAFLVGLGVMVASWAMTVGNSKPAGQQPELPTDRMYS
jgi:hypothetical protein